MKEFVSPEEAVSHIKDGEHVHLSAVASVPHCLVEALRKRAEAGDVKGLKFHHFHTEGPAPYADPAYEGALEEQGFFVGPNVRKSVNAGYADYVPVHLLDSQACYRKGIIRLGAALVNVSLPDENGMVSFGTSVDCTLAAVETARLKIAVVNPHVPFSYGNLVPVDTFDYLVYDETPLVEAKYAEPTELDLAVGGRCSELIEDGDCLQMGIGALPNALVGRLADRRHLGLHTEMFADGLLRLIKSGAIDNSLKTIDRGCTVASFLLGSREVYDFIDHNPAVLMKDIKYTNDPWVISRNAHVKAVNSATEVDLTGQICADSIGERIFSGTGGQLDFVRGASLSEGGASITAFASRTKRGESKIVPTLKPGAGVVTPRADAHWIVTEHGAVDLTGRSLQERAKLLISVAHPDDRNALDEAAFARFGPHYHNFSI